MSLSSQAYTQERNKAYFGIGIGVSFPEDRKREESPLQRNGKESLNGYFSLGYRATDNIAIQVGLDYIYKNEYKQPAVQNTAELLSRMNIAVPKVALYLNHKLNNKIGFYLGGGIGAAMFSSLENELVLKGEIRKLKDKTKFHCSGDVGVSFNISDRVELELGYSYGYYGKVIEQWDPVTIHSIKTGIRFAF